MVPSQATAAALIVVGYLMISALTEGEEEAEVEEGVAHAAARSSPASTSTISRSACRPRS